MRIDRRLNLVVPIYEDEPENSPIIAYVHSTPLSETAIDQWFVVLGKTYNAIWSEGFGFASGPGHAARILRHIAEREGMWMERRGTDGSVIPGVERGLMGEIRRLTNVLTIQKDGTWAQMPWDVAIQNKLISDEDRREVENAIVFFIVSYATLNRNQRASVLERAGSLWGAQLSSFNSTEFGNSLKTSTGTVSSGEMSHVDASEKSGHAHAAVGKPPRQVPV
jgi:hypothetical protein